MRRLSRVVLALGAGVSAVALAASAAAVRPLAGGLDRSFGRGGIVTHEPGVGYPTIGGIAVQPDGKIVAVGSRSLARYLPLTAARR